ITRLAVPYTGMILTCRETPEFRREVMKLGISQIDAGSNIGIGAYHEAQKAQQVERQQFELADDRSLDEIVRELAQDGYMPSFCTACYRKGRTGDHFMGLARKAFIKQFCAPNACSTFQEYLEDYASDGTKQEGQKIISRIIENELNSKQKDTTIKVIKQIKDGERDIYI
ncbi:MAG: [FeFe] hydrogenase H-cluster radical SAM maturase HydG, partial [Calditrichia bacterium]|nr:[FeFe] hydrogenase H-cluster radical SAM maturase HydG [Calditrichia bacterium]